MYQHVGVSDWGISRGVGWNGVSLNQNSFHGRGKDIFWNNIMMHKTKTSKPIVFPPMLMTSFLIKFLSWLSHPLFPPPPTDNNPSSGQLRQSPSCHVRIYLLNEMHALWWLHTIGIVHNVRYILFLAQLCNFFQPLMHRLLSLLVDKTSITRLKKWLPW